MREYRCCVHCPDDEYKWHTVPCQHPECGQQAVREPIGTVEVVFLANDGVTRLELPVYGSEFQEVPE